MFTNSNYLQLSHPLLASCLFAGGGLAVRGGRAALLFILLLAFTSLTCLAAAKTTLPPFTNAAGSGTIDLSGEGWKLWRDQAAKWESDELFLPPADLTKIPPKPPTGGWEMLDQGMPVSVPGTAEEYLGTGNGKSSMVKGVTWWTRQIEIPASAGDKKIRLLFDSTRQIAEVYVNRKLAAYDLVGNTPFEANLTGLVKPGEKAQLAIRITNPGGGFASGDVGPIRWGKNIIPTSHAFGGITGGVHLAITDPVYFDDLYVQNTAVPTTVNIIATVRNTTGNPVSGSVELRIRNKATGKEVFQKELSGLIFLPGLTTFTSSACVADAKLWDLENPNLYLAIAKLSAGEIAKDTGVQTFGFRWFSPEGIGSNALLRLNGKRIVLRTAISWGFWPVNGVFPTPELAAKQIQTAKAYGLNMLNFHRCIGNPIGFDKADEMGLLYYEEPGGYTSAGKTPFAQALAREKLLRMVKRDRSHPSLVIYNMINEQWATFGADKDPALLAIHRQDLQDAHAIDPSRLITYASAWAGKTDTPDDDPAKMHMRPFDSTVHMKGWWDFHRANGPAVWKQAFYKSPSDHFGLSKNLSEVVYWGEDGAISTPPRLGLIEQSLQGSPRTGWDGQYYRDSYKTFNDFLTANKLKDTFPTVDALCQALGVVSIEHQGRKIEDTRICDANDGYAINGWEDSIHDNHSAVVDSYRNPKADPAILAYYNQPLYVAVKPRQQILPFPGSVAVDFFLINEKDLKGNLTLQIRAVSKEGKEVFSENRPITAAGGDVYGQLIAEAVEIPLRTAAGMTAITGTLVDGEGKAKATGRDEVLAADWKSIPITGKGAVYENGSGVRDFLKNERGIDTELFDDTQANLDWLIVAKFPNESFTIPPAAFLKPGGKYPGVSTSFFAGHDFTNLLGKRDDDSVDINVSSMATPDPQVPMIDNYSVRMEGELRPPVSGEYTITLNYQDGARLWIDGKQLLDEPAAEKSQSRKFTVALDSSKLTPFRIELLQKHDGARLQMLWKLPTAPSNAKLTSAQILERARRDGTTVLILAQAGNWLESVTAASGVPTGPSFALGMSWDGGQYFVKDHPLFAGLPVNQALNWPYQGVVERERIGLDIRGGELVAGAYGSKNVRLGSAVSVLPAGQGKIIVSALDIVPQLNNRDSVAEVARLLLCNFLNYATKTGN